MIRTFLSAVRMWWRGCAGHRLMPWRSPYLRWRVETYSGIPAGSLRLRDFVSLAWRERAQVLRYLGWLGEMRQIAVGDKH